MTDATEPEQDEHVITVEATQIYRADVTPPLSPHLTQDGVSSNILGKNSTGQDVPLEFHHEEKRTYECSCGEKFRKGKTARDHLEQSVRDSDA